MNASMRILRIHSSAKTETSESRRVSDSNSDLSRPSSLAFQNLQL
jgi:hypothetical protein